MCISYEKCPHNSGCCSLSLECSYCPVNPPRRLLNSQSSLILLFILPLLSLLLSRVQLLPHSTYLGTEAMTQLTDTRHVTAFMGSAKLGASLRRHSYSARTLGITYSHPFILRKGKLRRTMLKDRHAILPQFIYVCFRKTDAKEKGGAQG